MLAALLCNLGAAPAPPEEVPAQRFGGGPFWRRYGYDSAYDAIRALADEEESEEIEELVQEYEALVWIDRSAEQERRLQSIVAEIEYKLAAVVDDEADDLMMILELM